MSSLRSRLLFEDARAYGPMLMSGSPLLAELMAGMGYDHLIVDHEHSPIDVYSGLAMLQAIDAAASGCTPIVRVPANDVVYIKKVLDTMRPPAGILVPMIESRDQAEAVVSACRYPPQGVRGCAFPFVRGSKWGIDSDYIQRVGNDLLIIVQVESAIAVTNIREIAAVPGVDCIFLGPFDISCSIGKMGQFNDPEVVKLMKTAEQAVVDARRASVRSGAPVLGGFRAPGRSLEDMFAAGYQFVCGGVELGLLREGAKIDVMAARQAISKL